jgi:hypothetical protein
MGLLHKLILTNSNSHKRNVQRFGHFDSHQVAASYRFKVLQPRQCEAAMRVQFRAEQTPPSGVKRYEKRYPCERVNFRSYHQEKRIPQSVRNQKIRRLLVNVNN